MTLDEAIKHCEEVAEDNECTAHSLTKDGWQEHFDNLTRGKETEYKNVRDEMANSCLECAEEHRQLAEWLKELKQLREQTRWIPTSERLPKAGEYVGDVDKYYLVQNEYGDMLVARYTHSEYWEQIYQLQPIGDKIVAWMPLPKPYMAESEEDG